MHHLLLNEVLSELDLNRPSAERAVTALLDLGLVEEITGAARARIYRAPGLIEAAYGNLST